jgi:hypothetical protein
MRILCAHPAFCVLEMSLSQLGEKQIAPDEALNDRSLLSISQRWTDKNYFAGCKEMLLKQGTTHNYPVIVRDAE